MQFQHAFEGPFDDFKAGRLNGAATTLLHPPIRSAAMNQPAGSGPASRHLVPSAALHVAAATATSAILPVDVKTTLIPAINVSIAIRRIAAGTLSAASPATILPGSTATATATATARPTISGVGTIAELISALVVAFATEPVVNIPAGFRIEPVVK
jgi:hypothetical protein